MGARDHAEIRATLFRAMIVAAAIDLLLIAVNKPLGAAILSLMGGSQQVTIAER